MNELHTILQAWRSLGREDRDAVLATVVHVTGSAYRRPGARMLLLPDGRRIGSVSGGCLEGEIAKKAWWFTESGTPLVRVYDTSSDDDAVWEFGLGCNGVVHVLLERVPTRSANEMLEFLDAHRSAAAAVVATVTRGGEGSGIVAGDRLMVDETGVRGGALAGTTMETKVLPHARAAFLDRKSRLVHLGETQVFVEWIGSPRTLVVFGAGHDAVPLVAAAAMLGWSITVVDGRPAYARSERFPGAERVVLMSSDDLLRDVPIGPETAVVMMTHNYPLDARLLPEILGMRPFYLGLLGPRKRAERLFEEAGIRQPANVHAPVGLDIGGEAPAAIALSIVAEVQAAINERSGGMLQYREGAIHAPALEFGATSRIEIAEAARPGFCETTIGYHV